MYVIRCAAQHMLSVHIAAYSIKPAAVVCSSLCIPLQVKAKQGLQTFTTPDETAMLSIADASPSPVWYCALRDDNGVTRSWCVLCVTADTPDLLVSVCWVTDTLVQFVLLGEDVCASCKVQ